MEFGKAIGSAALGGLTGGVGGLISGAIGGLGSLMGIGRRKEKKAQEAEEREHQRQLEYMGLQAQYNKSRQNTVQSYQRKCGTIPIMRTRWNILKRQG